VLDQHQSSAAGTKGLDANQLALLFAVRIQYDVDRITRDVLDLPDDVRVPILSGDCDKKFQLPRRNREKGEGVKKRRKLRTLNTAFAPSLRISP
jgi:hypothetical protein